MSASFRIGQGWDRHRLKLGLKLFLGGVEIPFEKGAIAHSDGDVLIHALIDALLGAVGLGDIGTHFPPSDLKFKNIDSKILLEKVSLLVLNANYTIVNIDSTIITEQPKLKPYLAEMKECLASILKISPSIISIKAKTAEQCDAVGREEAIEAQAVILLEKIQK